MMTVVPTTSMLTGTQKAALLLIQIGKEQAARVMSLLDEQEIEELTPEIARFGRVDPTIADGVIEEFHAAAVAGGPGFVGRGGLSIAQQLLEASVGREKAADMIERL